jgi:hypothetical protein
MAVWGGRSGGEGVLMMSMPMMKSAKAASVQTVYEPSRAEEKSITQQILDLEEAVKFLEKIWLEEPEIQREINEKAWQEFMEAVYNSLFELQMQDIRVDLQR